MGGKRSYVISQDPVELIIPGYPKGSNLTILNTAYCGRKVLETEDEEGEIKKSVTKDFIAILFRDNDKGVKKVHVIYEPLYTFYLLDEDYELPDHNLFFIEKDKVVPITCKYADILKCIAEVTDNKEFYMENVANQNAAENRKLHMHPSVFMSDMNVENYYRFLFSLSYKNEPFKLKKGFLDIETDGRYAASDFPEPGEVPINAIAFCDEANNVTYQFLLDDPRNPEIEKFKKYIDTHDIVSELRQFVIDSVGGYKKAVKFGVDKMDYKLVFFKDERELIRTMFQVINRVVPDFMMIWNMAFDLNYIIARCEVLGMDPMDVICDKRVEQQFLRFYVDERNKNSYEERGDFVSVSTFTVWIDQMISFASRRKGRGRYASFKLDAIGEDVANVNKLDYSHITRHIEMLPYKDFKTFSFYNVMDVIVQKCIETVTQDCEYVFTKCLVNNTIYPKCHRQSVYLANRFAKDFYQAGYIIGNNKNLWNEKPTTKFPGAMVGDPTHNEPATMMKINGRPSMLSNNAVDFD